MNLTLHGRCRVKIYKHKDKCNIAGKNIRNIRNAYKLSQEELAAQLQVAGLNLNQKAISRIETGDRVVADYELKKLAELLRVPVDTLLDEA